MAMSNSERQRKFRMNRDSDSERRWKYLQKCKEKYKQDKAIGKKKLAKDMSSRELRQARKYWRKSKKQQRQRKELKDRVENMTPPSTPERNSPLNRQMQQSNKKKKRGEAKCYRDNRLKDKEIESLKKKVEMYKKRWQREAARYREKDSPKTKTRRLLRQFSTKNVRKALFNYHVLIKQLQTKYDDEKKRDKIRFVRNISGPILKKYRIKMQTFRMLGIDIGRRRKKEKACLSKRIYEKVKAFYLRDDNSRIVAGMKKTVTKGKKKKQRRILCDNLINLHKKFLSEGKTKLSYPLFCKMRPFWVLFPRETDRNTCLCKTCDNVNLMIGTLYKSGVIYAKDTECLLKEKVCDINSYKCMYGLCNVCKNNSVKADERKFHVSICFSEWKTKVEKRIIKDGKESKEKDVKFTVKETITCPGRIVYQKLCRALELFLKHQYNCLAQYRYFKRRRENLSENECIVHIDFSENYVCKLNEEIQSMHFGASKKQITLHTGVLYLGKTKSQTFCTVSDSLNHDPVAIWSHLKDTLLDIRRNSPRVEHIEFFSDGPTTQYRQKTNFYLLSTEPSEMGFKTVKWSFFEAGHGKGVPDAVGGSIKREADRKVMYGEDILSAKMFVEKMKSFKTKVNLITEEEIEAMKQKLTGKEMKPVPGTMKIHQVIVKSPGSVYHRQLSCACDRGCDMCSGIELNCADILVAPEESQNMYRFGRKRKSGFTRQEKIKAKCQNVSHDTSEKMYGKYLADLSACMNYEQLKVKCEEIEKKIPEFKVPDHNISIQKYNLEIDFDASVDLPDDVPLANMYPCIVHADGNCLPSTGSVLAFGNPNQGHEMRVRILLELVQNESKYLDQNHLQRGMRGKVSKEIRKSYVQYSDMYVPGVKLTIDTIKDIYRKEVLSVTKDKSFMGIWQVHALASVLKRPVYSVYPNLGSERVRKDLNRLVMPVAESSINPAFLMWTSTREDQSHEHWVPNHFVPVVKLENTTQPLQTDINNNFYQRNDPYSIILQEGGIDTADTNVSSEKEDCHGIVTIYLHEDEKKGEIKLTIEGQEDDHETPIMDSNTMPIEIENDKAPDIICDIGGVHDRASCTERGGKTVARDGGIDDVVTPVTESKYNTDESISGSRDVSMINKDNTVQNACYSKVISDIDEKGDGIRSHGRDHTVHSVDERKVYKLDGDRKDLSEFLGSYVIIKFNQRHYLGFVENINEENLFIECMRSIGKKSENRFAWPKRAKDKSWYPVDSVMKIIEKPTEILSGHYKLDEASWNSWFT